MDLTIIIGMIGSLLTIGDVGNSFFSYVKQNRKFNLSRWRHIDPNVDKFIEKFNEDIATVYQNHIFTKDEKNEIVKSCIRKLEIENEDIANIISEIIDEYNEYQIASLSKGEKVILDSIMSYNSEFSEDKKNSILNKLCKITRKSSDIVFGSIDEFINKEYEIDRSKFIDSIDIRHNKIVLIQGNAGSGKSVVAKKLLKEKEFVFATRAEALIGIKSINEIWEIDIEAVVSYFSEKEFYFFVDAIEFVADCGNIVFDRLEELYRLTTLFSNVRVIITCRTVDSSKLYNLNSRYVQETYEVPSLTVDDLNNIGNKYPIIKFLQQENRYSGLLTSPFYINLIVSKGLKKENINDENDFRKLIWENLICLKEKCFSYDVTQNDVIKTVENIVFTRSKEFLVGVYKDDFEEKIIKALISEDVLICNGDLVRLKYDIYEDICFERYIDKKFDLCRGDYNSFYNEIEKFGRSIYRRYQIWISNKLFILDTRQKFIYTLLNGENIESEWKKQTEIGIVKSDYCGLLFEEFQDILDFQSINELIRITNLYAFKMTVRHDSILSVDLIPIGEARKYLIEIIYNYDYDMVKSIPDSLIVQLCDDYSICNKREIPVEKKACELIIRYIDELTNQALADDRSYLYTDEIVRLFLIICKMSQASEHWINSYVNRMIDYYSNDDKKYKGIAEFILKSILQNPDPTFVSVFPDLAIKVANTYWIQNNLKNIKQFHRYGYGNENYFGLSNNTNLSSVDELGVYKNTFIWYILKYDFKKGFDWVISFLNHSVSVFNNNYKEYVEKFIIYNVKDETKKSYFGNLDLWTAGETDNNLPILLNDVIYIFKLNIIRYLESITDRELFNKFANYIKKSIYESSNNIALLSVIETVGMYFMKELPGYALDLVSSMNLIYLDINRYVLLNPDSQMIDLRRQIFQIVGIPDNDRRYQIDNKCIKTLQTYAFESYFYLNQQQQEEYNSVLDYLYSIYVEDTYPKENLQIQKIDVRNAIISRINNQDDVIMVEPKIQGRAKEIYDERMSEESKSQFIYEKINNLVSDIKGNEFDLQECINTVNVVLEMVGQNELLNLQYEKIIIQMIAGLLHNSDITIEQRNFYIKEWLVRIKKVFQNKSYIAEIELTIILWEQLNFDIDKNLKDEILKIMLESVLSYQNNGIVRKITRITQRFLRLNNKYAKRFFNTILKLAEDKKTHQKYNVAYLTENNIEYDPNILLICNTREIDNIIVKNNGNIYVEKNEEIIDNYLFNDCELNISSFNIDDYKLSALCYICKCGLDLYDDALFGVLKSLINKMIEVWNKYKQNFIAHRILDVYDVHAVSDFLKNEMNLIDKNSDLTYECLLVDVDFSLFTEDTFDFYEDVLCDLIYSYYDGFRYKGTRSKLEKKIKSLEKYIENIPDAYAKKRLEKSLFLCVNEKHMCDISKVETKYNYMEKTFINQQIIKYGKGHFISVIKTVYTLNIDQLLPEILISVNTCFEDEFNNNKTNFPSIIHKIGFMVDKLIINAFLNCSDEIKKDKELVNSYENILKILIEIQYKKAAVLLDEFRIH